MPLKIGLAVLFLLLTAWQPAGADAELPLASGGGEFVRSQEPCLTDEQRTEIQQHLALARADLRERGLLTAPQKNAIVSLRWPLRAMGSAAQGPDYHGISNFVDQNSNFPNALLDYNCGNRTYDLSSGYNHQGIDFFTWPMPWRWMDEDAVQIVAGAAGTILSKFDGNFDESCGLGGGNWNAVYVEHIDGSIAWYGHMKSGSTTPKTEGQTVAAGEYLGVVGSSGNSTGPHLHLELYDGQGSLVEPYAGPCNSMNAQSWWATQRPYYDSGVNRITVGDGAPSFPSCPGRIISNEVSVLPLGSVGYFTTYYRDQRDVQQSQFRILTPQGTEWTSWSHFSNASHYAASYWWWSFSMPAAGPEGVWTFEVSFQAETIQKTFVLGSATAAPAAPEQITLGQNRPNPFNPATAFQFSLPREMAALIAVYDVAGTRVRTLIDGVQAAGTQTLRWNGRNDDGNAMPSGIYFYRLEADGWTETRKMALVR